MQINESEQKIQNEINKLEIIDGKKRTFDQMEKDDTLSIEKLKIDLKNLKIQNMIKKNESTKNIFNRLYPNFNSNVLIFFGEMFQN